jgi:hypothetical protein
LNVQDHTLLCEYLFFFMALCVQYIIHSIPELKYIRGVIGTDTNLSSNSTSWSKCSLLHTAARQWGK